MEEQMRILKMVEEGKISAEQAAELMSAVKGSDPAYTAIEPAAKMNYDRKMFRVIVDSAEGDKVNVQIPIKAIKQIMKVTGKLPIPDESMKGVNMEELMEAVAECLDSELTGDIVNVEAHDGTIVKVYID